MDGAGLAKPRGWERQFRDAAVPRPDDDFSVGNASPALHVPGRGMRDLRPERTVRAMAVLLRILFLEPAALWGETPEPEPESEPEFTRK